MRLAGGQPSRVPVATRGMEASFQGCRAESWTQQLGYLCESDKAIISQATPVAGFLSCAGRGDSAGMVTPVMASVCADHSVYFSGTSGYLEVHGLDYGFWTGGADEKS